MRRRPATRRPVAALPPHPDAHTFDPDPILRGYCRRCELIKKNRIHDPAAIAARASTQDHVAAAQAEHRRRTGEAP